VKTLSIISADPEKGSSPVAVGLACALAQAGERVLLVDGDLSSPTLAAMLRVEAPTGLAEVLEGKVPATDVVVATSIEGLNLMAAGSPTAHPGDLLGSKKLPEALKELSETYDHILVSTPDLSNNADAISLAAASDSAVWVVAAGEISEDALTEGCKRLQMAGASILGFVLNTT
jgi:capsular exopolysaccharide synthesis family protein